MTEDFDLDEGLRRWEYGDRHAFTLLGLRRLRELLPEGHRLVGDVDRAIVGREKMHAEVERKYKRA